MRTATTTMIAVYYNYYYTPLDTVKYSGSSSSRSSIVGLCSSSLTLLIIFNSLTSSAY